jgi:penicillin-binding protein 2
MNRLILPKLAVLLILVALVGRLYQLQLAPDEIGSFRDATSAHTVRFLPVRPIRGEVYAADGRTLLAESVPIYTLSVRPADLPSRQASPRERDRVFAQLGQLLGITTTLTISPAVALDQDPVLRNDLTQGLGAGVVAAARRVEAPLPLAPLASGQGAAVMAGGSEPQTWAALDVPAARGLVALKLSQTYSTTLKLANPIADKVDKQDIPGYQTLAIEQDIPREVALVLRENAASLPGVVVEQDYRRRYPLSGDIQSLSHLLGFTGRVGECDLVRRNTARSWVGSLLDSIGHAEKCGIITKKINPNQLGIPLYLENDRIGKDGVEASYETELRGQLGWESILVDAAGQPVRAPEVVQPASDGNNLVTTIDVAFQRQVEQILRNWIDVAERRRLGMTGAFAFKRDYKPLRSGVAIVMDVHTGRVLAMASWPSYDDNVWNDSGRVNELNALLDQSNPENRRLTPLLNRAIALQYPPGSTLKQFDASVVLQKGIITPSTRIHDAGRLVVANRYVDGVTDIFPNAGSRAYGDITVSDGLKVSSNIFFMSVVGGNKDQIVNLKENEKNIPEGLGPTKFAEGMGWFGLGQPTGIRLAGEMPGLVPTPAWKQKVLLQAWTTGDLYNAAIGQGNLEVTPLQLITGAAAVANNGDLYRPQIVKMLTDATGRVIHEPQPELVRKIPVDPSYLAVVRDGMRRSVTEGVNRAARDACSSLQIAGKTGTAEFGPLIQLPPVNGKPRAPVRQSHSWFVGFAPYDNPQIEVLALVEGSGDMGDGSATITVPAVTQIMQAYFRTTPPNPLPRDCQQDLPPLPPRVEPAAAPSAIVDSSSEHGR